MQVLDKTPNSLYVDSADPEQASRARRGRDTRGCMAAAWHYASLGFAEHPLRKHR